MAPKCGARGANRLARVDDEALHIAIDANVLNAQWGGIPKYLHRIAALLAGGGDRVDLLANQRGGHFGVPGANEVAVRVKGAAIWRNAFVPLWAGARRPDVYWAPATLLPRLLPIPSVVTLHDLAPIMFPGSKPPHEEAQFRKEVSRSARAADRLLAVSAATREDAARLWDIDRARIHVVGNGVDERFSPGDRDAALAHVRDRFGIDDPIVMAVGSLEPRKGLDVLIQAAALARAEAADWRLVLVGASRAGAALDLGADTTALGAVADEELVQLYRAAAAVAVPSIYEGFGITALEAMACGTPVVIAAGSGGLEEVSGAAAVTVGERTPRAWCDGLDEARRRREELAPSGMRHAARYTWPAVAAATRAVLAEAARSSTVA